ncbi:hypothetical protein [Dysgonomonas macrotermitis]|uniref:ECF transporter S component n=1 Tax=Dysgonomonas macrotermitis TaxID=1346286 RepID=A0A1M5GP60_9BACT|nr:hypothetical protein [Dysgonomonas macrotermitis]SHG05486.1 hypothetical protein SAMN05444362_11481 [Dysgonomonas macrotermitis]
MESTTLKLYSLNYKELRTYLVASAFVLGNIILPQICHLIPNGGLILLPIYFFTLIGAYKYGWKVGLLTAILSPSVNFLLFSMPPLAVLPAILLKSVLLAGFAGLAAKYFKKISVLILLAVVLSYQVLGTLGEWLLNGNFILAIQDFRLAIPGMLLQIFGGYLFIKHLIKN